MTGIAATPEPPYWAVIFTSQRAEAGENAGAEADDPGYDETAARMLELAAEQHGFLGVDMAHEALGITVSYWASEEAVASWRQHAEHLVAQRHGRERWYSSYALRVCRVERASSFGEPRH